MWPPLCRWRPPYALMRVSRVLHVWRRNPCLRVGRLLPLSESSLTSAGNEWCFGCRVVGFNIGLPYAVTDLRQAIASADRAPPCGYPPGLPDAFNRVSPRNKVGGRMQFVRWTRVVCCCWTTGAFTSCSKWRPLPSQDVLLRRRLPNSPLLTWVAFPPHPGPLTLRHGLLLQGGWRSSTAAAAEAAGQPGMLVGVVQQFVIALLWVQYRSPSVPVIDGHGNDAVQTRGSALVSSVHEKYRKEGLPWSHLRMAMLPSSVIIHFLSIRWRKGFGRRGAKVKRRK